MKGASVQRDTYILRISSNFMHLIRGLVKWYKGVYLGNCFGWPTAYLGSQNVELPKKCQGLLRDAVRSIVFET
jgi:hypothetical protein